MHARAAHNPAVGQRHHRYPRPQAHRLRRDELADDFCATDPWLTRNAKSCVPGLPQRRCYLRSSVSVAPTIQRSTDGSSCCAARRNDIYTWSTARPVPRAGSWFPQLNARPSDIFPPSAPHCCSSGPCRCPERQHRIAHLSAPPPTDNRIARSRATLRSPDSAAPGGVAWHARPPSLE